MSYFRFSCGALFPMLRLDDGRFVADLRMFPARYNGIGAQRDLTFDVARLRAMGVHEDALASAALSSPVGFALIG